MHVRMSATIGLGSMNFGPHSGYGVDPFRSTQRGPGDRGAQDLKHHAGLAHLPSGRFAANAAWLALVGVAYNLARWTANAAGLGRVTTKTLRLTIIAAPARLVTGSRRRRLRMPTHWPWAHHIRHALTAFARIPAPG